MAEEMTRPARTLRSYNSLEEILLDKQLASLGDSYVNFVFSLAMSQKHEHPMGAKVRNQVLADAVELSGLRELLPRRVDKHTRGNAAEALLVFAWLQDTVEMEDCINVLVDEDDPTKAFAVILQQVLHKLGVEHEHKQARTR
jgi:hypothetical protein